MALRKAAGLLTPDGGDLPESFWYSVKRRLLGPPLTTDQLEVERLSKPLAELRYFQPPGLVGLGGQANWVMWAIAQVIALTW